MSNNELFISTYLDKIARKININDKQAFGIFSMATTLDKIFENIYINVVIANSADRGTDVGIRIMESW